MRFCGRHCFLQENRPSLSLKRKRASADVPAPSSSKHSKRDMALQPIQLNSESRFDFNRNAGSYNGMTKQFVPCNTKKNNDWAYKSFEAWLIDRNQLNPDCPCPRDLLEPPWVPAPVGSSRDVALACQVRVRNPQCQWWEVPSIHNSLSSLWVTVASACDRS